MSAWERIWGQRRLPEVEGGSLLRRLMAADGFDTAQGRVTEEAWRIWLGHWADRLGVGPGSSVYEAGCGAGAALFVFTEIGCRVAGIDRSASLVDIARSVMPEGDFEVGGADRMDPAPTADAVISASVFMYFPSLDYAASVVRVMAAKATRAVAILDVPDPAHREAALAYRQGQAGGPDAYAACYAGLEHLHIQPAWLEEQLREAGLVDVASAPQDLPGYGNAPFRYNCWGFRP